MAQTHGKDEEMSVETAEALATIVFDRKREQVGAKEIVAYSAKETGLDRTNFAALNSFADAVAMFGGQDALSIASEEIGDGSIAVDKDDLVGVPFIVTGYDERMSTTFGTPFFVVRGITRDNTKFFFIDGSRERGVRDDLESWTKKTGYVGGLFCPRGLSKSVYTKEVPDENGEMKEIEGRTYFIDTRKGI